MTIRRLRSPAVVVMVGLLGAGCAQTQPSRFYTLSSLPDAEAAERAAVAKDLAVGVGPISLPNYLDRPEIVRRASPNQFQLAEFDRWGEPLQDVFPRVMAENLADLLATDRVFLLPRRRDTRVDYQVEVEVTRFDADVGGSAVLAAKWEVFDNEGNSLRVDRVTFAETVTGDDYGAVATAMSRTVAALSHQVAAAVTALHGR